MRKIIAAINTTIDGFCDHTAGIPDEEIHQHYGELLLGADAVIYGRITYQLMESYWPAVVKNPTGTKSTDDFAVAIDNIPKIVFSRTLDNVVWKNSRLATRDLTTEISNLKSQSGNDVLVGSPGMIDALTVLGLIDEYQICVHPVILGKGQSLFRSVTERSVLRLVDTKHFKSGALILYYNAKS